MKKLEEKSDANKHIINSNEQSKKLEVTQLVNKSSLNKVQNHELKEETAGFKTIKSLGPHLIGAIPVFIKSARKSYYKNLNK